MKTIVYFYSRMGSNRFLAKKIAADLNCEIEEIKPRVNYLVLMLLGINLGNVRLNSNVEAYDKIILCGPIWMGKLIVPLRNFVSKHLHKIGKMVFVSCCGSTFENKDEKFGHNLVFQELKKLTGEKCVHCEAFPIRLILTEEEKKDTDADIKYHLNNENFKGEIIPIYNTFIEKMKEI
jgi:menaquinone-dependent protoporphyrinogen IX oxidase